MEVGVGCGNGTRAVPATSRNSGFRWRYYGVLLGIMSELKTISFRMETEKVETLDALAESMDRDRTYLLNEAVERYLELNEYHIKLIKKGLRAAEAGDFVPEAEMKRLIAKMRRAK